MALVPLTTDCNQRCVFCSAHGRGDSTALKDALRRVREIAAAGGRLAALSGGETTFSGHLPRVIAFARAKGLEVEIQTNGLTSCYPARAARLAALKPDLFNVNFPSHRAAVNDRLTGTRGTLPLREAGVRNLLAAGAPVRLTHIVSSLNYRDLPAFARYAAKKFPGLKYIQFSYLKGVGLAAAAPRLLPPYAAAAPYLRRALAACAGAGVEAVVDHIPPCFLGRWCGRHVDFLKAGAGEDTSLARAEKRLLPACRGCALAGRCFGPRAEHAEQLPGGKLVSPLKRLPPGVRWT